MPKAKAIDKNVVFPVRMSQRVYDRMQRTAGLDGNSVADFVRLAVLREVERRERVGRKNGA